MNNIIEKIRAVAAKYYNGGGYIGNIMYTAKKGEELKVLQTNTPKLFDRINKKHFDEYRGTEHSLWRLLPSSMKHWAQSSLLNYVSNYKLRDSFFCGRGNTQ